MAVGINVVNDLADDAHRVTWWDHRVDVDYSTQGSRYVYCGYRQKYCTWSLYGRGCYQVAVNQHDTVDFFLK